MSVEQAKVWLRERGAADWRSASATVAELFAMAAGELEPEAPSAAGI